MKRFVLWGAVFCLVIIGSVDDAAAQRFRWPQNPENLKVLEVSGSRLGAIMRGMTGALGVRCQHCHVNNGDDNGNLATFDFASDEKPAKEKARLMLQMVMEINTTLLAGLSELGVVEEDRLAVNCTTCHRGSTRPVMIQDVISETMAADGVDAAEAKYRELRERFFGGFVYDFRPRPIARLAEGMAADGTVDEAVQLLEMSLDFWPEDADTYVSLGQVLLRGDRTEEAISAWERAQGLMSPEDAARLQARIDRIRGGDRLP